MAVRLVVRRAETSGAQGDEDVQYEFEQPRLVIGRSPSADLRLPALTVSDLHATLEQTERGYTLRDMRSTNGTRVNGAALVPDRARTLHEGDTLQVGEFTLTFHTGGPVTGLTTPERTVSLAKRLLREGRETPAAGMPTLHWRWAGTARDPRPLPPPPVRWLLGASPDADLAVEGADAAGAMLELELRLDGPRVRAIGELEVLVNGKPVRERLLRDGDRVQCGAAELWLDDPTDRALRSLEGQADAPLEPTVEAPAEGQPSRAEAEPRPDSLPESSPTPAASSEPTEQASASRRPSLGPDALVYALALAVLAASAVGMLWLLGE